MKLSFTDAREILGARMDELPYPQSVGGPRWMSDELVATEASRERLLRWFDAGRPEVDAGELRHVGDISLAKLARDVLATLPAPARWYVVRNVLLIGVGLDSGGWCENVPRLLSARMIALPEYADDYTCLHEFGHAWLHGSDDEPESPLSVAERRKRERAPGRFAGQLALQKQLTKITERIALSKDQREREAEALAHAWRNGQTTRDERNDDDASNEAPD